MRKNTSLRYGIENLPQVIGKVVIVIPQMQGALGTLQKLLNIKDLKGL